MGNGGSFHSTVWCVCISSAMSTLQAKAENVREGMYTKRVVMSDHEDVTDA